MSFTIKCDNCGNEEVFKQGDNPYGDKIHIEAQLDCGYTGCIVETIDFDCDKCFKGIQL